MPVVGGRLGLGLGLGRLPSDLSLRRGNVRFRAPIATPIVLFVLPTIALNLFRTR